MIDNRPWIKAVAKCIITSDINYSVEDNKTYLQIRADYEQDAKIITRSIEDLDKNSFANMLIALGEDFKKDNQP